MEIGEFGDAPGSPPGLGRNLLVQFIPSSPSQRSLWSRVSPSTSAMITEEVPRKPMDSTALGPLGDRAFLAHFATERDAARWIAAVRPGHGRA